MKKIVFSAIKTMAFATLAIFTAGAGAQTAVNNVPITQIRTGWGNDQFALETGLAIVNPANCSAPDGYVVAITNPGYRTHLAVALMAFSTDRNITIIVSNTVCVAERPLILGLYINK